MSQMKTKEVQTAQELIDAITEVSCAHGVKPENMHINITLDTGHEYNVPGAVIEVLYDPEILSDRSVASNIEIIIRES